ncbi:MAG: fibronectin type III domain-containing protein [Gammaproteobacteria bacterium]
MRNARNSESARGRRGIFRVALAAVLFAAVLFGARCAVAQQIRFVNPPGEQSARINQPVSIAVTITRANGVRYEVVAMGLPPGLALPVFADSGGFGTVTKHISGAPTAPGRYSVTLTVRITTSGTRAPAPHRFVINVQSREVNFESAAYMLAENAASGLAIPVILSLTNTAAVEVAFSVSGTAVAGADYAALSSPLRIAPNAGRANLNITPLADGLVENDETIRIALSPPDGHTAGATSSATLTLTDSDRDSASIAFGADAAATSAYAAGVSEDAAGGVFTLPLSISHAPGAATTFLIDSVDGIGAASEGAGGDYRLASNMAVFPAGAAQAARTRNITITLNDDALVEDSESITLRIRSADAPANDLGDYYARNAAASAVITLTSEDVVLPPMLTVHSAAQSLRLAWTPDPSPGNVEAGGYRVRWRLADAGGGAGEWNDDDGIDPVNDSAYTITGLRNGSTYDVQIAATTSASGNSAWSLSQSKAAFSLDADASGALDGKDGLLLARYLLGVRGGALTDGVSGASPAAADIIANLDSAKNAGALDADGNNTTDWKDGILFARYLLGLRGAPLTAGVTSEDASTVADNINGNLRPAQ